MAEISVIVPVYNVDKYLGDCLESIINQTFSDIEIICVNDGSVDNSLLILEEYKKKDLRIKTVSKVNGGLSSARNAGLAIATGKFISFVDSDDRIAPDMLEKLHKNITSLNTDIAICATELYDLNNNSVLPREDYFSLKYFDKSFDYRVFSYKDTLPFINDVCVMAWNKLYRHSFLKECNAQFPNECIFEDGPFFFSLFFRTEKVSLIRDFLYFYGINRQNSILSKCDKNFTDIIDTVNLMYSYIKDIPEFDDIKYDFFRHKASDIIYRYNLIDPSFKSLFRRKLKEKSILLDDRAYKKSDIFKKLPYLYIKLNDIKNNNGKFVFFLRHIKLILMRKIIRILDKDYNSYYIKINSFVLRIPMEKFKFLLQVYYRNEKIHINFFFERLKFKFDFQYELWKHIYYE